MLTCLVPVLFTIYIQGVLKLKKNNYGSKGIIININSWTLFIVKERGEGSGDRKTTWTDIKEYGTINEWI